MPLYDFKCPQCGRRFEARTGINDPAPACPACQHHETTRLITSAPTFAKGILTHAGDGHRANKEQLQSKWAEETPKLRKKLSDKLGEDAVRSIPSLNISSDD